jgi:hypothetical protein
MNNYNKSDVLKMFIFLVILILGLYLISLFEGKVNPKNKVAIIARLSSKKTFGKTKRQIFYYYFKNKFYNNYGLFDSREFKANDLFLLYIDSVNPSRFILDNNKIKLNNTTDLMNEAPNNYYINKIDFELLINE